MICWVRWLLHDLLGMAATAWQVLPRTSQLFASQFIFCTHMHTRAQNVNTHLALLFGACLICCTTIHSCSSSLLQNRLLSRASSNQRNVTSLSLECYNPCFSQTCSAHALVKVLSPCFSQTCSDHALVHALVKRGPCSSQTCSIHALVKRAQTML